MSIITPPPYGRPDYSAPLPVVRQLIAHTDHVTNGLYVTPTFSTANWAGIELLWFPTSNPSFVEIAGYDTEALSNLIWNPSAASTDGNQVIGPVTFPSIAPYAYVQLQHYPSTGGNQGDELWVYVVNPLPPVPAPFAGDYVTNADDFTVPGNGSYTYTYNSPGAGPARLWISSAQTVTWELQRADGYGGYITIDGSTAAATVFREQILLPISESQLVITNTTATNSLTYLYITSSATGAM